MKLALGLGKGKTHRDQRYDLKARVEMREDVYKRQWRDYFLASARLLKYDSGTDMKRISLAPGNPFV